MQLAHASRARLVIKGAGTDLENFDDDLEEREPEVLLCGKIEVKFDCAEGKPAFKDKKTVQELHASVISWLSYLCVVEVLLLPFYIAGGNFLTCGRSLSKTTAAYLADADVAEGFVAFLVSLHLIICAYRIVYLYSGRLQKQLSTAMMGLMHQEYQAAELGPPPPWREQLLSIIGFIFCIILSGLPSFFYAIASTTPPENQFLGGFIRGETFILIFRNGASFFLVLVNSFVIPSFVNVAASTANLDPRNMLLIAKVCTTWLFSCLSFVVLSNDCWGVSVVWRMHASPQH